MTAPAGEVARLFGIDSAMAGNAPVEVYPGYPGMVFDGTELRSMAWGFPLVTKGKSGQPLRPRPVNNARSDKLSGPFWKSSFIERRCLIPVSAFAEAEGKPGSKTRTWVTVPGEQIFTAGGIWRNSEEWGPVYAMVMSDACTAMEGLHARMPVLIADNARERWLSGSPAEAFDLCRPWPGALTLDRTDELWVHR